MKSSKKNFVVDTVAFICFVFLVSTGVLSIIPCHLTVETTIQFGNWTDMNGETSISGWQ